MFAQVGIADKNTNPVSWSITGGLSGRGSIPRRDDDTWGVGYFYNDVQELAVTPPVLLERSQSGIEFYYDIFLARSVSLTFDVQQTKSAFSNIKDATILGARLNVSF